MVININYISELPIEKLNERINKGEKIDGIRVTSEIGHSITYSIKDYKKIYKKMNELIDGIDQNWSNEKKFVIIYKRITANIKYDYMAIYEGKFNILKKTYARKERDNCRSLKNGLLYGKCVCQGYAEILRNACSLLGVKAIEIGDIEHSWNQVQMSDGKWIEIDATWGYEDPIGYIGENKENFWSEHGRMEEDIFKKENEVKNFDLVKFINSEFGLNVSWYSKNELIRFISLIEIRDVYKKNIKDRLSDKLIKKIIDRQEFEQETGCTIKKLKDLGFPDDKIKKMQCKTDRKTGKKLDRRKNVQNYLKDELKKIEEIMNACGYTIEEMRKMGIKEKDIQVLQNNYNSTLEERKIKTENIEEKISLYDTEKTLSTLEYYTRGLHPKIEEILWNYRSSKQITPQEAIIIAKFQKGEESYINVIDAIHKRIIRENENKFHQRMVDAFERECGYTTERLIELGFYKDEIEGLLGWFDERTGKRLNRKKIVEKRIKERKKEFLDSTIDFSTKNITIEDVSRISKIVWAKENYKTNKKETKGEER